MTTPFRPPTHVLEVLQHLEFDQPLAAGDPRYVDTDSARGNAGTFGLLAVKLGLELKTNRLFAPTTRHILFFGHTGSGKSTELRTYGTRYAATGHFLAIEINARLQLDVHNIQYPDIVLAMAEALLERLEKDGVTDLDEAFAPVRTWFEERVLSHESLKSLSAEIKTSAEASIGVPLLTKLFARFTVAMRTNSEYKESLRVVVRNYFAQLKDAFNAALRKVEDRLKSLGTGHRVLFLIDGTDHLKGEDTHRLFVEDAEQIVSIETLAVYTAPIHLKYGGGLTGKLDAEMVLPMVRVKNEDGSPFAAGRSALRDIVLRRADRSLFTSDDSLTNLVNWSGGHVRDLLRLLRICCEYAESGVIDVAIVDRAATKLAAEYRYLLSEEDYVLLAKIDTNPGQINNDERTQRLLFNLALLQYNDGSWQHSHPVIERLEGYLRAKSALVAATPAPQ